MIYQGSDTVGVKPGTVSDSWYHCFCKPLTRKGVAVWRVSIYILLFLMSLAVARAEEPNTVQRAVIAVNRIAQDTVDEWEDARPLYWIEDRVPLDEFRFYVKPKISKSIKKGKFYYTVGFTFTF
jgi:hypothetical protein